MAKIVDRANVRLVPVKRIPEIEMPIGTYRATLRRFAESKHTTVRVSGVSGVSAATHGFGKAIKTEGLTGKVRASQRGDTVYLTKMLEA